MTDKAICRTDGRCEYAIQSGAEKEGSCQAGKCAMPCDNSAAHLTIPGALEWDGDNGTHGVVGTHGAYGESRADGESKPEPTPIGEGMARLMHAYDLGEFSDEGGSATVESLAVESYDAQQEITGDENDCGSYMAGYCAALYEQGAPLLHEVGRLKSFRLSYMEWSDKTEWVQETAQPRELGKHRADVITERVESLRAQLDNTEQSRRSFFDLSQDLEKRLAERDAVLNQAYMALIGYLPGHRNDLTDAAIAACGAILFPAEAKAACSRCGGWGHIETEESAHDCTECGPSVIERAVEAGVMNAPSKTKICIECDQPYCHGVCVERGDQGYDRDQAARGGDQ